jgi:hypothetical protein
MSGIPSSSDSSSSSDSLDFGMFQDTDLSRFGLLYSVFCPGAILTWILKLKQY